MLKVGELAERAGLTVRTLHHYDSIGLLRPSARSDAGYRLYDRDDVARLQQIQALRKFGMALADVGTYLDSPDASPLAIIEGQLASLDRQIEEATQMRQQLLRVHAQLSQGEKPELATWLSTLEQMTMYDKYFSKQELEQMPMFQDQRARSEWQQVVTQVQEMMDGAVPPHDEKVKSLARRWLTMLDRDTAGDHYLALKLNNMHENEPQAQRESGITPELKRYIMRAIGEVKGDIYARYLPLDVIERMRRHQQTSAHEWAPLIEKVRVQMQADPSPAAPAARELARQWLALTHEMLGTDPDTIAAFRQASLSEPLLRIGRGMTDEMLDFLRKAMTANRAAE
jgi:MerR family transcriptional regulator, thiopeptide resistance regulator